VSGNVDACELTIEERAAGLDIGLLVAAIPTERTEAQEIET
jgi:hypothetical protein